MKTVFAEEIRGWNGDRPVDGGLFAVDGMEIKQSVTGAPYLALSLKDRTGTVPGLMFDCDRLPTAYSIGDPVMVSGTYNSRYSNINIKRIDRFSGEVDKGDFLASTTRDVGQMWQELLKVIDSIEEACCRELLLSLFTDGDVAARFSTWPAAKDVHHSYTGGLLEHTLGVVSLCEHYSQLYSVERDVLLAGALLHDIGKLQEMACDLVVTYTDIGYLLGHTLLGCFMVRDTMHTLGGFPKRYSWGLLHIVASHHGELEWGAIVRPMTMEAFLVSMADGTDARSGRYQMLIDQQRPLQQSVSARDFFLETRVYAPRTPEEG